MTSKLMSFILENFYTSFVIFFYYYLFTMFVELNPLGFGFHPNTDLTEIASALGIISLGVLMVKSFTVMSYYMNSEHEPVRSIGYIPGHRHL